MAGSSKNKPGHRSSSTTTTNPEKKPASTPAKQMGEPGEDTSDSSEDEDVPVEMEKQVEIDYATFLDIAPNLVCPVGDQESDDPFEILELDPKKFVSGSFGWTGHKDTSIPIALDGDTRDINVTISINVTVRPASKTYTVKDSGPPEMTSKGDAKAKGKSDGKSKVGSKEKKGKGKGRAAVKNDSISSLSDLSQDVEMSTEKGQKRKAEK